MSRPNLPLRLQAKADGEAVEIRECLPSALDVFQINPEIARMVVFVCGDVFALAAREPERVMARVAAWELLAGEAL